MDFLKPVLKVQTNMGMDLVFCFMKWHINEYKLLFTDYKSMIAVLNSPSLIKCRG